MRRMGFLLEHVEFERPEEQNEDVSPRPGRRQRKREKTKAKIK